MGKTTPAKVYKVEIITEDGGSKPFKFFASDLAYFSTKVGMEGEWQYKVKPNQWTDKQGTLHDELDYILTNPEHGFHAPASNRVAKTTPPIEISGPSGFSPADRAEMQEISRIVKWMQKAMQEQNAFPDSVKADNESPF